jgi:hypothetical protein
VLKDVGSDFISHIPSAWQVALKLSHNKIDIAHAYLDALELYPSTTSYIYPRFSFVVLLRITGIAQPRKLNGVEAMD